MKTLKLKLGILKFNHECAIVCHILFWVWVKDAYKKGLIERCMQSKPWRWFFGV